MTIHEQLVIDDFRKEIGRVLGFYDFGSHTKITFPQYVGNEHPELTEAHETIHRDLCNTTTFGFFQKLLATLIKNADSDWQMRSSVIEVLDNTIRSSWLPHEAAAVYVSFALVGMGCHDVVVDQQQALSPSYAHALRAVMDVLPFSNDSGILRPFCNSAVAMSMSIASLNNAVFNACAGIDQLAGRELATLMDSESPNSRFRRIIEIVKHSRLVSSLEGVFLDQINKAFSYELTTVEHVPPELKASITNNPTIMFPLADQLQRLMVALLRRETRDIHIVPVDEGIDDGIRTFHNWQRDLKAKGLTFLSDIVLKDTRSRSPQDDLVASTTHEYVLPGEPEVLWKTDEPKIAIVSADELVSNIGHLASVNLSAIVLLQVVTPEMSSLVKTVIGRELSIERKSVMITGRLWDVRGVLRQMDMSGGEPTHWVSVVPYDSLRDFWSRIEEYEVLSAMNEFSHKDFLKERVDLPVGAGWRLITWTRSSLELIENALASTGSPEETYAILFPPLVLVFARGKKTYTAIPASDMTWNLIKHRVSQKGYKLLDDTSSIARLMGQEVDLNFAIRGVNDVFSLSKSGDGPADVGVPRDETLGLSESADDKPRALQNCPICEGHLVFDGSSVVQGDFALFTCPTCSSRTGERTGIGLSKSSRGWK